MVITQNTSEVHQECDVSAHSRHHPTTILLGYTKKSQELAYIIRNFLALYYLHLLARHFTLKMKGSSNSKKARNREKENLLTEELYNTKTLSKR